MMRNRIRSIAAILATLCVVALCGCSFPGDLISSISLSQTSVAEARQAKEDSASPQISSPNVATEGTLTVGLKTGSTTAPLCIVDGSGNASGIDVDLASAIADELGLSVKFVSVTDAKSGFSSGCDIVMDVETGESSDTKVIGRYTESAVALFQKNGTGVSDAASLTGKTVGLQKGSTSQKALSRTSLVMTQKEYDNLNSAFDALNAGSVDYVLCDAYAGAYLSTSYTGIAMVGTIDVPTSAGVGIASSNTELQTKVQTAMDTLTSNGEMDIIRSRWIGSMDSLTSSSQVQGITNTSVASTDTTDEVATSTDGSTAGSNAVTSTN